MFPSFPRTLRIASSRLALLAALITGPAVAQCATQWLPGIGWNGTQDTVRAAATWDPDGAGPQTPVTVLGGDFLAAGTAVAHRIATHDPVSGTWAALGSGMNGSVYALCTLPNGDLVAGGAFTSAGGVATNRVARWDGTSWSPLGSGTDQIVYALATMPNGDLVAAGEFTLAGGISASRIARWNGTSWSALGAGISPSAIPSKVQALAVLPNGDLVATGFFTMAGTAFAPSIARWDGSTWWALGAGLMGPLLPGTGHALVVLPNGDLVVGGEFSSAGGVPTNRVARWDGSSWTALDLGTSPAFGSVAALAVLPSGSLVAAGSFDASSGVAADNIAVWSGTNWLPLGTGLTASGPPRVSALCVLPNGGLLAAGSFRDAGGVDVENLALWNGAAWSAPGPESNGEVTAVATMPNGDLVVGGTFTMLGGVSSRGLARRSGTTWTPIGSGLDGISTSLAVMPNGDLIVGGQFTNAGGVAANNIARWNGSSFAPLGSGITGGTAVFALAVLPNGDLVAGGFFTTAGGASANNIARWNGTNWSPLGSGTSLTAKALVPLPNGDLVAGGDFSTAGGLPANRIARWNGSTWSSLGAGANSTVHSVIRLANGDLVAAGSFTTMGGAAIDRIARWNGIGWSGLGSGLDSIAQAVVQLPDGDLLVGGWFQNAGGSAANRIARWNGTNWSPVGLGIDDNVLALATLPNGDVVATGSLPSAGNVVSRYVAQLTTTCPATAAPIGAGCASSGGTNTLSMLSLPWTDTPFRAAGSGLPNLAIVVAVTGLGLFAPGAMPMTGIHPQGIVGCDLRVTPDIQQALVTANGTVQSDLFLPSGAGLIGLTFFHQMIPIEVDAAGGFLAITATNALRLVAGDF